MRIFRNYERENFYARFFMIVEQGKERTESNITDLIDRRDKDL